MFFDNMGYSENLGLFGWPPLVHDTTNLGKIAVYKKLSSLMPNENRVQTNFYRCEEKIPVNVSIFLPYTNKRCSLLIIGS